MSHIKQVDIGKVYSVEDEFSNYIQPDEVVHGCFRDLRDYLPRLAMFYLWTKQKSNGFLRLKEHFWWHWVGMRVPLERTQMHA